MKKAIFLDLKDVLNKNVHYSVNSENIGLDPNTVDALQQLQSAKYLLVIVSNQPGIAFS